MALNYNDCSKIKYGYHAVSKDTGCEFFPKCLECPFPKCQFEEGLPRITFLGWVRKWRKERDAKDTRVE